MDKYSIYLTLSFIGVITVSFLKDIVDLNDPLLNKAIKKYIDNLKEITNKIED